MGFRHLGLGLILTAFATSAALGADTVTERASEVLKTPGYEHAQWGVLVVDAKTGQVVFERNPDELFCPASVTKLFTTAAALADLGADYRFQTPVHYTGTLDKNTGRLDGNLILVASGDLSLGGRTGPDGTLLFVDDDHSYAGGDNKATLVEADPLAGLDFLAREMEAAGIKSVTGDVLIDDRLFAPARSTGSGPSRVSPIVINDNIVDVVVSPGSKPGDPATVKLVPETSFVTMDAQVTTVAEGTKPSLSVHAVGSRRFTVRGEIPIGHAPIVRIYEVEEPASFARALFIETLRRRGISVTASPLGNNPADALPPRADVAALPKAAEYTSPPFREFVKVILKVSQNLHASTLPLLVAAHAGKTTLSEGLKREGELLKSLGVNLDAVSFGGGAGGSRSDLVSPRATVTLLQAMSRRPDYPSYEAALPILGRDGTLATAVSPESPARGHVHAKTGTYWVDNDLTGQAVLTSKALAGTMETASGRTLVFAFFLNNVPIPGDVHQATESAKRLLGRLCEVFYQDKPSAPSPPMAEAPKAAQATP